MSTRRVLHRLHLALLVGTVAALAASLVAIGWGRGDAEKMRTAAVPAGAGLAAARQSLVEADTAALDSFANPRTATAGLSEAYRTAIAAASRQLAQVSEADLDATASQNAQVVESLLATYQGLLQQAALYFYADPRSPLAEAYLQYGYDLLHDEMLPLMDVLRAQIRENTPDVSGWARHVLWIVPVVVLLAFLAATQIFLARRFRRTLSLPLLLATVAVLGLGFAAKLSFGIDDGVSTSRTTLDTLVENHQHNASVIQAKGCEFLAVLSKDWYEPAGSGCRAASSAVVDDGDLLAKTNKASVTTQEASDTADQAIVAVSVLALVAILLIMLGMLPRIEEYRYRPR